MGLSITPDYSTYADAVAAIIERERALAKIFATTALVLEARKVEPVVQETCPAASLLSQPIPASV